MRSRTRSRATLSSRARERDGEFDAVFGERLQSEARPHGVFDARHRLDAEAQPIAEPQPLDFEVAPNTRQLLTERHEGRTAFEGGAHEHGELFDDAGFIVMRKSGWLPAR